MTTSSWVIVAIVWSGVVLGSQALAPLTLPDPLRAHVKDEDLGIVTSIRGLPLGVREELQTLFGSNALDIAEPDGEFQATEVIGTPKLPTRRSLVAGCSEDHRLVYYSSFKLAGQLRSGDSFLERGQFGTKWVPRGRRPRLPLRNAGGDQTPFRETGVEFDMRLKSVLAVVALSATPPLPQTNARLEILPAFTPRESSPAFVVGCRNTSASPVPWPRIQRIRLDGNDRESASGIVGSLLGTPGERFEVAPGAIHRVLFVLSSGTDPYDARPSEPR